MPDLTGVNHVALSVTDLDVSQAFYTEVLGFLAVLDVGHGRVLMHRATGFTIAVVRHPDGHPGRFDASVTGLDHLGLAVDSREELVAWEQRLVAAGVEVSPIQDMPLGHHLNFRDPDGIALELQAPTVGYAAALELLRTGTLTDADVLEAAEQMLGPEVVARPRP